MSFQHTSIGRSPGRPVVPVIAMSAYADAEHRAAAQAAGFDTYCAKPIDPAELIACIAREVHRTARRDAG